MQLVKYRDAVEVGLVAMGILKLEGKDILLRMWDGYECLVC